MTRKSKRPRLAAGAFTQTIDTATFSHADSARTRNPAGEPAAARTRLVCQHALWRASQPQKAGESVFASIFRANQKLGNPLSLKQMKRLARKAVPNPAIAHFAVPNPAIAHFRDPVAYHQTQQTIADAQAALSTLPWPGAFAHHCRLAMIHILHEMRRIGKTTIALSCRDLADNIGVTKETAARCQSALCGNLPHRRATVPNLLTCRSLRSTQPTAANVYHLRPRRAWRLPAGGLLLCVLNNGQKQGEKRGHFAEKFTTRQRVLDAIGRRPIGSAKELITTAGMSEKTAELTLTWLRKNELVKKIDGVYRLLVPRPQQAAVPDLAHDMFRHRALGKSCAVALAAVAQQPIRAAIELTAVTTLSERRARRALGKLRKWGLVEKAGVYRVTERGADAVAQELGTAGIGKKQRAQHTYERDRFRKAVENGELHPGFGKKNLHVLPMPEPPAPRWSDDERPVLRQAASWKPYRKDSSRERQEMEG